MWCIQLRNGTCKNEQISSLTSPHSVTSSSVIPPYQANVRGWTWKKRSWPCLYRNRRIAVMGVVHRKKNRHKMFCRYFRKNLNSADKSDNKRKVQTLSVLMVYVSEHNKNSPVPQQVLKLRESNLRWTHITLSHYLWNKNRDKTQKQWVKN